MNTGWLIAGCLACMLSLSGCSHIHVLYDGPRRPLEEVCFVTGYWDGSTEVSISVIDGKSVNIVDYYAEIPRGVHKLWVGLRMFSGGGISYSKNNLPLELPCEGGRVYEVRARILGFFEIWLPMYTDLTDSLPPEFRKSMEDGRKPSIK